jgi:hypothetical protein
MRVAFEVSPPKRILLANRTRLVMTKEEVKERVATVERKKEEQLWLAGGMYPAVTSTRDGLSTSHTLLPSNSGEGGEYSECNDGGRVNMSAAIMNNGSLSPIRPLVLGGGMQRSPLPTKIRNTSIASVDQQKDIDRYALWFFTPLLHCECHCCPANLALTSN